MANINSTSLRNNLVQSLTMSGNLTWAKADFKGKFTVFISTNSATTRTLTISNTGFVAGDFLCLLIDQNSSGSVSITIGTRSIASNKGNIINAIFDGTNWNVWSGGGVFNTSNTGFTNLAFGYRSRVPDASSASQSTAYGVLADATGGNDCLALGYNANTGSNGGRRSGVGSNSTADADDAFSLGVRSNSNGFTSSINLGNYSYARRFGALRYKLDNNASSTDTTNPSANSERVAWRVTTANNTITEIFLRGVSSNRCVLQAKNVLSFSGQCVAFRSDYTGSARWDITGLIKRDGSNVTTLVGVTATLTHSDGTGGTLVLTIDADDTNEALRVRVTGNASETWTWLVELELLDLRIA
jgi:hypothetical protein